MQLFVLDKESHAKRVSKAWSEPDSLSDDNSTPVKPSPKKKKIMFNPSSLQEDEICIDLPKAPTTPIRKRCKIIVSFKVITYMVN